MPAELLATMSYVLLAPWEPSQRPWTLAPLVVLLLAAAWPVRRTGRWTPDRWDLPIAVFALVTAIEADDVVLTSSSFALISFAVAAVLRRWPWAVVGATLALATALDAGHGWLALVLAAEGLALTTVATHRGHCMRALSSRNKGSCCPSRSSRR